MRLAPQEIRTFFVTLTCANRRMLFQVNAYAHLLLDHLQEQRTKRRMALHAFVVMPDHVHLLLTPAADLLLEKCIQFIKGGFSFRLGSKLNVWQRGYFDKRVPDAAAYHACIRYIDENPVKAGLCDRASQFALGSAARENVDATPAWFCSALDQG